MSTKKIATAAKIEWERAEEWLDSARYTYNYEVEELEAQQERDAAGLPRPQYGRSSGDRQGYVDHAEANYLAAIKNHGEKLEAAVQALTDYSQKYGISGVVGNLGLARAEVEAGLDHCRRKLARVQGEASAWRTAAQLAAEGPIG